MSGLKPLSDDEWLKIRRVGQLPETALARQHIEECFADCRQSYHLEKVSPETRAKAEKARKLAASLSRAVALLANNDEFLRYGSGLSKAELARLERMESEINQAEKFLHLHALRLKQRRKPSWIQYVLGSFISELLFVRADHLGLPVPFHSRPTSETGPWLEYIFICLSIVDADIPKNVATRCIDYIMEGHNKHRKLDEDLFRPIKQLGSQRRSIARNILNL